MKDLVAELDAKAHQSTRHRTRARSPNKLEDHVCYRAAREIERLSKIENVSQAEKGWRTMSEAASMIHALDPFRDICPFCLDELRHGVPEDGKCGHEGLLATYPHLRFNASDHLDEATLKDSQQRYAANFR